MKSRFDAMVAGHVCSECTESWRAMAVPIVLLKSGHLGKSYFGPKNI